MWEDCFLEGGLTAATAALVSTDRVSLGLLPVPLRNPALAAMEIATLERVAPGRLVAGFGHGVLDWMGQVDARVASPLTLLREYVTALRALLEGETVDVAGRYVSLADVALGWPPAAAPETAVGATRPKTLRLAGELGDSVLLDAANDAAAVRAARAAVEEGRAVAGRPGRPMVRAFAEIDPRGGALAQRIADRIGELSDAGSDAIAIQTPADALDPRALLESMPR